MGRPSKDLHVVIGVLLLQQLHDLSDAETVEALAFNMAWRYALDVRSEADSCFCEKTLRNYRRLFIEQGLDELLFRCLTDVNGGAKLVHPGGAKLVHLMLCGTRCWGVVPVVHRRDPRCFV